MPKGQGKTSQEQAEQRALELFEAALDLPPGERDAWLREACAGDAALEARIRSLLRADSDGSAVLQTGGATQDSLDAPDPERAGGYAITRLIGRGGMGAVYMAARDRGDFEHTVAIKVIRPGALRDSLIERFNRERQILASLNHTNIARLYDGGVLEDGSPFIVMEYVDGSPLLDWVEAEGLSRERRLALFEDICAAISHAHQNLVVHRDITPANVLVTREGTAKVIDFGIAKPHSLDTEPAEVPEPVSGHESLSYTPGYAAPERATGAPANTLSDVYSLGKLLRDLLSGRMIHDDEAVIARATATAPEARYTSVDALQDDVQRLRDGRAVAARRGGPAYVFRRFAMRNRVPVTLAALFVFSLIAGLATTTGLYQRAEAERAAADSRFEQVRSLASFMMFDLYDELDKVTGNTRTISMLADEADNYLQSLAADDRASLEVKIDTVNGLKRLADIMGNPKNRHIGERGEAGALLEQALQRAEDLFAQHPDNREVKRSLADIAFSASTHTYVTTDSYEKAHDLAVRSAVLWDELSALPDATFNDNRQAVRAYMMTAVPLPWIGRPAEAIERLKEARDRAQELVSAFPSEIDAVNLLGSMNVEVARAIVRARGQIELEEHDLPYWNEAIRLRHEAYERNPDTILPYRALTALYAERGASWRGLDEYDKAYADALEAERIAMEILRDDPDDAWVTRRLGGILEEKIKTLSYGGRHEEAVAQADDVLDDARAEYRGSTTDFGIKREFGYTLVLVADVYAKADKIERMCEIAREARQVWDELLSETFVSELDREGSIALLERLEPSCE